MIESLHCFFVGYVIINTLKVGVGMIPKDYKSSLDGYKTQTAIGHIKHWFEHELFHRMHLKRVTAPLFVESATGINDDLSGVETAVSFMAPDLNGVKAEVVHSLAKWKRMALKQYQFRCGNGFYTDMNAIRQHEILSPIHSLYVDQWDWERVISNEERTLEYLKTTVQTLVDCVVATHQQVKKKYPEIQVTIEPQVTFISAQALLDQYPDLTPKEREHAITRKYKTVFIYQIGDVLSHGEPHDGRAPDYDDWTLNGDLLFYHAVLDIGMELSSMGIRVNAASLRRQCELADATQRLGHQYHQLILNDALPLTIGGGLGQSRMCMLLLGKAHIGEVQVSLWDEKTLAELDGIVDLL